MLSILSLLTGCAGVMVVREALESYDQPPFALDRKVGFFDQSNYKLRERGLVEATTRADVLSRWGEPARRSTNGTSERWHYERELAWSGIVAYAIVPIPLVVPVGYRKTVAEFNGDTLVRMSREVGRERGGVCGLVYRHNFELGCVKQ